MGTGGDVEQPVGRLRPAAFGGPTRSGEPALQAVGTEMFLHHEMGRAVDREQAQPSVQQLVECGLADPYRRVRPDSVEPYAGGETPRFDHLDVVEAGGLGVDSTKVPSPLVDVDGPDLGRRISMSQGQGDRAVAATEVEQVVIACCGPGAMEEQEFGSRIDALPGEHSPVGQQRQAEVGKVEFDRLRLGRGGRVGLEIVIGRRGR